MKALAVNVILLAGALGLSSVVFAQDTEPNHPCPAAQELGVVALPFVQEGSLDSILDQEPPVFDVDFFRLTGTPGQLIQVDLEGASTGAGTLVDPFLGAFGSGCDLIALNDDFNGLNSRLVVTFPVDGVLVLGVTQCCDGDFVGGGGGTYRLTVSPFLPIGSISGRVLDAVTGVPLPGDVDPFAVVELQRCEDFGCFPVSSQPASSEGQFHFMADFNGQPLAVGTYQVAAGASQYQPGQTAPFTVDAEEDRLAATDAA